MVSAWNPSQRSDMALQLHGGREGGDSVCTFHDVSGHSRDFVSRHGCLERIGWWVRFAGDDSLCCDLRGESICAPYSVYMYVDLVHDDGVILSGEDGDAGSIVMSVSSGRILVRCGHVGEPVSSKPLARGVHCIAFVASGSSASLYVDDMTRPIHEVDISECWPITTLQMGNRRGVGLVGGVRHCMVFESADNARMRSVVETYMRRERGPGVPVCYQRIWDMKLNTYVHYTSCITRSPSHLCTQPSHSGSLDTSTHEVLSRVGAL